MTKKTTEEFWRRLKKAVDHNLTPAAVDAVFADFRGLLDHVQVDASEETERNDLLMRALRIGDRRTSGNGAPIEVVSEHQMLIDGDTFNVTISGGTRDSRTKIIEALRLAVGSVFANQPNVLNINEGSNGSAFTRKGTTSK
jgi:hypothetical protein